MSAFEEVEKLVEEIADDLGSLPTPVLQIVHAVVQAIKDSPDPVRAAKRAAMANASEQATEEALKHLLGRSK